MRGFGARVFGRLVTLLWGNAHSSGLPGTSEEAVRAVERNRRASQTTFLGVAASGIGLLTTLISVPLTLTYLGTERFGLWMTISSVMLLLGFTDLGIGNGLMSALARARARGDEAAQARYVTSGLVALTILAAAAGLTLAVVYPLVPWRQFYNVHSSLAASEAGPATLLVAVWFIGRIPLGAINSIRSACQEGYVNYAFTAMGNLLGLVLLLLCVNARFGLPLLVSAVALAPFVAQLANLTLLFGRNHPELVPSRKSLDLSAAKEVVRIGLVYFVLQLSFTIGYLSDTLVLTQILGQGAVTQYSVVTKLFSIPATLAVLIVSPLWPAYREAFTRGDMRWVRATLRRSVLLNGAITLPAGILLTAVSGTVFAIWVGRSFSPPSLLVLAAATSMIVLSLKNSLSILLNGAQIIRLQLATAVSMAVVNLACSIVLTLNMGVSGVLWGSVIAAITTTIIPDLAYFKIKGVLRQQPSAGLAIDHQASDGAPGEPLEPSSQIQL